MKRIKIKYPKKYGGWNTLRFWNRILWSITVVSFSGAVFLQLAAEKNGFAGNIISETLFYDPVNNISINTNNLDIYVKYYDGDEISVDYKNDSAIVEEKNSELQLKISQDDRFTFSFSSFKQLDYKMTVLLPIRFYDEITLTSSGGDIYAYGLVAENLNISVKNGSINILEAEGEVTASSAAGDINADFIYYNAPCSFSSESGNINIKLPESAAVNLEYKTESGNLTSSIFPKNLDHYPDNVTSGFGKNRKWLYITSGSGNTFIY